MKQIYFIERTDGGFRQITLDGEPGFVIGFDEDGDVTTLAAGSGGIEHTTAILKGTGTGGAMGATASEINAVINSTVAPTFPHVTSKPTTAVGYGISGGANLDALSTKSAPTGALVGTTANQTLTNKTIDGGANDISLDASQITGISTFNLATPVADEIIGFGITSGQFETWGLGPSFTATGTDPDRVLRLSPWLIKTTTYTAVAGDKIQAVTTAGAFTITLPISATVGDEIRIEDGGASFATNNLTIARNGLKINNGTSNFTAATNNQKLSIVYISTAWGWSIK